ncbi:MAG: GxxExxY protein [Cellvibrionaceae bacterium]|jgi:GxxExxY protein
MKINEITGEVIGAAIEVHRSLGPGLLESAYETCLCRELALRNIPFRRQVDLPIEYKGVKLATGYRIDILIMEKVVLELKAIEKVAKIHEVQLVTYLKLGGWQAGLLINFNEEVLRRGIRRKINGTIDE